jgi:hypothetical protein
VKVTVGGRSYTLVFAHYHRNAGGDIRVFLPLSGKAVPRAVTYCTIVDDELTTERETAVIGRGRAIVHPNDNFNKETGRKLSLRRALKDAGFSHSERTVIWLQYLMRDTIATPADADAHLRLMEQARREALRTAA